MRITTSKGLVGDIAMQGNPDRQATSEKPRGTVVTVIAAFLTITPLHQYHGLQEWVPRRVTPTRGT